MSIKTTILEHQKTNSSYEIHVKTTHLEELVKINEYRANIYGIKPLFQILNDAPQTPHKQLHILTIWISSADRITKQAQQSTKIANWTKIFKNISRVDHRP